MGTHQSGINSNKVLSWEELSKFTIPETDRINGPTNSYSTLRLFSKPIESAKIVLYRDHHAWCPYCQKIWLWLEWKKIPYKIKKVTMFCYGKKELWYKEKVPSGMLPAIEIDNQVITESDDILIELEKKFGPLGLPIGNSYILRLRELERKLFRAWCIWLCNPALFKNQEERRKETFILIAKEMEKELQKSPGPYFEDTRSEEYGTLIPGSSDVIFIPYLERMNASLAYYKGYTLRKEHPTIDNWFKALEKDLVYLGTQGDFHTHAHDLPPQMGGCWVKDSQKQKMISNLIDNGNGLGENETSISTESEVSRIKPESIALTRVLKHKEVLKKNNPLGSESFDQPLRAALTAMLLKEDCLPQKGSAPGLRYLRDRISVPRDMPLLAARSLRKAIEKTAQLDSSEEGSPIPTKNRLDQDPSPFIN